MSSELKVAFKAGFEKEAQAAGGAGAAAGLAGAGLEASYNKDWESSGLNPQSGGPVSAMGDVSKSVNPLMDEEGDIGIGAADNLNEQFEAGADVLLGGQHKGIDMGDIGSFAGEQAGEAANFLGDQASDAGSSIANLF